MGGAPNRMGDPTGPEREPKNEEETGRKYGAENRQRRLKKINNQTGWQTHPKDDLEEPLHVVRITQAMAFTQSTRPPSTQLKIKGKILLM